MNDSRGRHAAAESNITWYFTGEPLKYDVSCDFQFELSVASDLSAYKRISWVHAAYETKIIVGFAFDTQDLMNFL
jgi:hypothetical protein